MGELLVVIRSSTLRTAHDPHRRRGGDGAAKTSPPKPWRPKIFAPRRPPLLSDTRRHLVLTAPPRAPDAAAAAAPSRELFSYYAALASKLAGSGKLEDFLMVAESVLASDALAAAPSQFVARIDTKLVAKGVCGVLRGGDLRTVLEFVSGAERLGIRAPSLFDESGIEALAVRCRELVEGGRMEEFVEVMETLSDHQFQIKNIVDPLYILKIFVEKTDPVMAVRYASLHSHSQLLFCSIIDEFGRKKDLTSAFKAFEEFKNKSGGFNMFACRSIVDVCGLCGDSMRSREFFEELLSQKIIPNTHVFNSIMNVNAHDLKYTLYVYKHMQNLGVAADVTSYNVLLKACCLAKRVDLAQDIYKEMRHMESASSLELDVITYSTMIKAFSDVKMLQMALKIKEDMLLAGISPNIVTWSSLIGACAKAGFVDQAMQVFEEMLLSGCEPNSQCCNNLLYACVHSCQYDRAFRLYNTWKVSGFRVFHSIKGKQVGSIQDSATKICPTSVTHSNFEQHADIVKVVPFKPTVSTYNILMKACGRDYYRAKNLMDEMIYMGLSPNQISWSTLIDICGSTKNMKGAMQAFKTMRDVGIVPDVIAYTAAIKACVVSKHLKIAFSLFEEMKRYRLQPNLVTYNTLLRARTKYGSLYEVQQCLAIYQDMRKAGYSSNDYYLKELLEEWCEEVISGGNEDHSTPGLANSCDESATNKSQSRLLEKVATHLQKDIGENRAVDLRGLSKVEARIVVLSVLQMMKENYGLGHPVKNDMVVIVGRDSRATAYHELEVQQTVVRVLQDDLGLDVVVGSGSIPIEARAVGVAPVTSLESSMILGKSHVPAGKISMARRPEDLGIIRVTRATLSHWLQKKSRD